MAKALAGDGAIDCTAGLDTITADRIILFGEAFGAARTCLKQPTSFGAFDQPLRLAVARRASTIYLVREQPTAHVPPHAVSPDASPHDHDMILTRIRVGAPALTITTCSGFDTDTLRCMRPIETATVCIREQVIPR
jgi:hypothetical protein